MPGTKQGRVVLISFLFCEMINFCSLLSNIFISSTSNGVLPFWESTQLEFGFALKDNPKTCCCEFDSDICTGLNDYRGERQVS